METRFIQTEEEREQYEKNVKYCFNIRDPVLPYPPKTVPNEWILGVFKGKEQMTAGIIYHCDMFLRSTPLKGYGFGLIATPPEHRNQGSVKKLCIDTYKLMKERGVDISFGFPFKYTFYEFFGYAMTEEKMLYKFSPYDIRPKRTNYVMKPANEIMHADILKVYEQVAHEQFDYCCYPRSKVFWEMKGLRMNQYICYDENGEPKGYIVYNIVGSHKEAYTMGFSVMRAALQPSDFGVKGGCLYMKEMFWLDKTAKQTLFNFVWAHRDQAEKVVGFFPKWELILPYIKNYHKVIRVMRTKSCVKLIDILKVLKVLRFPKDVKFELAFKLRDPICPWNDGCYLLKKESDETQICSVVEKGDEKLVEGMNVCVMDSVDFTWLVNGFKTVDDIIEVPVTQGEFLIPENQVDVLRKVFTKQRNYFADLF